MKHTATYEQVGRSWRTTCSCGWTSDTYAREFDAGRMFAKHRRYATKGE